MQRFSRFTKQGKYFFTQYAIRKQDNRDDEYSVGDRKHLHRQFLQKYKWADLHERKSRPISIFAGDRCSENGRFLNWQFILL